MADDIKRMDIEEFQEEGYLQELNRRFLHPLGLALEVEVEDDGTRRLGGVWDYRGDPEGIAYGPDTMSEDKARNVEQQFLDRAEARTQALGFFVQPIDHPGVGS